MASLPLAVDTVSFHLILAQPSLQYNSTDQAKPNIPTMCPITEKIADPCVFYVY